MVAFFITKFVLVIAVQNLSLSLRYIICPCHCVTKSVLVIALQNLSLSLRYKICPCHCVTKFVLVIALHNLSLSLRYKICPCYCVTKFVLVYYSKIWKYSQSCSLYLQQTLSLGFLTDGLFTPNLSKVNNLLTKHFFILLATKNCTINMKNRIALELPKCSDICLNWVSTN